MCHHLWIARQSIVCPHTIGLRGVKIVSTIYLPDIGQIEVDSAALGSQKAHGYTKEELRKMKKDGLVTIAKELYLDARGTKVDLVNRIMVGTASLDEIKAGLINFKRKKEKGKPCTCKGYGLFFNNVDNFDKVLSWTVEDLMIVYFIFTIKPSIANVYATYVDVAKDQISSLTVEALKVLLLEKVFLEHSTEALGSPSAKRAKGPRSSRSRQETAQASAERKTTRTEEVHNK